MAKKKRIRFQFPRGWSAKQIEDFLAKMAKNYADKKGDEKKSGNQSKR